MLNINKISADSIIDYAAEELKKYLRMMMPEGGDIIISYDPEAKDGFRLGLMQDLGLDISDAKDPSLDDVIYIDTTCSGGIIAGANARAVLIAVYEYLRKNGCEWLMPGVDGERIPMQDIRPVKYRHKPTMRYRGNCIEGALSQQVMDGFIDFMPKLGLNTFMIQFRNPHEFYKRHYEHIRNTEHFSEEPISKDTALQWTRRTECEMAKRGIMLHSCGHGWTNDPFGIDSSLTWSKTDDSIIPKENIDCIALTDGRRGFYRHQPANTQFCMSNKKARDLVVNYIADYAATHSNTDYLHVWLSDGQNNHCECDECKKMRPSDFYMMQMNEIDEELTKRNLKTRIVFISYIDTSWAPEHIKINNPERFALLFAPITRRYTETLPETPTDITLAPYVRNKLKYPLSLEEYFAYLKDWKRTWPGGCISYEYHFWRAHFYDVVGIEIAKRVNEDVKVYLSHGVDGIIEDGSQRAFFPSGLAFYTYARSMFDKDLSAEEIREDFFSHAFGKNWKSLEGYLTELSDTFDVAYMMRRKSADPEISPFYNPEHAKDLARVKEITARGRKLIRENYNSDMRVQTVAVRLLEHHADYVDMLADAMAEKALGNDDSAKEIFDKTMDMMAKKEIEIERYYDYIQQVNGMRQIFYHTATKKPNADTQD